jgi:hypothetical protein
MRSRWVPACDCMVHCCGRLVCVGGLVVDGGLLVAVVVV